MKKVKVMIAALIMCLVSVMSFGQGVDEKIEIKYHFSNGNNAKIQYDVVKGISDKNSGHTGYTFIKKRDSNYLVKNYIDTKKDGIQFDNYKDFYNSDQNFINKHDLNKLTNLYIANDEIKNTEGINIIDLKLNISSKLLIKAQNQQVIAGIVVIAGGVLVPVLIHNNNSNMIPIVGGITGVISTVFTIASFSNKRKAYKIIGL